MTKRDKLIMKILGLRQLIYDAPEHNVPEMERLLLQVESELKRLADNNAHATARSSH